MSAARIIENMGAGVALVEGKVRLRGLDHLDKETAARVLEVARAHREELAAELSGGASAPSGQDERDALAELDRFFASAVPDGSGGWISPAHLAAKGKRMEGAAHD